MLGSNWRNYDASVKEPPEGTFVALETGPYHNCALTEDNIVQCWGRNDAGQTDVPVGTYVQVSIGVMDTCALTTEGEIRCWGSERREEI